MDSACDDNCKVLKEEIKNLKTERDDALDKEYETSRRAEKAEAELSDLKKKYAKSEEQLDFLEGQIRKFQEERNGTKDYRCRRCDELVLKSNGASVKSSCYHKYKGLCKDCRPIYL